MKRNFEGELRFLVNRHSVSDSNRMIIRDIYDHLKTLEASMTPTARDVRKLAYRTAIEIHQENRKLYQDCNF